jgi:GT2 family glycosyltransferase
VRASVLIVEYNTRDYLADCLTSLENSELPRNEFEVIVVDNASPTPVDSLIEAYPRVRFLKSRRNLGFAGGNLLALSRARSSQLLLLNPDAVAHPAWLREMLSVLSRPDVGVVGCKILHPGTRVLQHAGGVLFANGRSEHLGRDQDDTGQFDEETEVEYVCGAAIGTRRDVIDAVGFLSPAYFPAYYEETELCVRARRAGYRVVYTPRAVVEHHESVASGGAQTMAYLRRYHESRMRFVYRNYSLRELLTRFVPQEVGYVSRQSAAERRICARSYVKGLFSAFGGADKLPRQDDVVLDTGRSKA